MKTGSDRIDRLRVASACPVSWEQMIGDDRVRFCDLCSLHVYDISKMKRVDAEALIARTEGRVCARLYRRADGTIITKDCPVGLRAMRRQVARLAGAVFATIMSVGAIVAGQKPASTDESSCQQKVKITRTISNSLDSNAAMGGTIRDPNGAAVPGARIELIHKKTGKSLRAISNDEGRFSLDSVSPGTYLLKIKAQGFKQFALTNVSLAGKEDVKLDLLLTIDGSVAIGIIGEDPLIPGKTVFSGDFLRKLPIIH